MLTNTSYKIVTVKQFYDPEKASGANLKVPVVDNKKTPETLDLVDNDEVHKKLSKEPRMLAEYTAGRSRFLQGSKVDINALNSTLSHHLSNYDKFKDMLHKNPDILDRLPALDKLYSELGEAKSKLGNVYGKSEKEQITSENIGEIQRIITTEPDVSVLAGKMVQNPFVSHDSKTRSDTFEESQMISALELLKRVIPDKQNLIANAFAGSNYQEAQRIVQNRLEAESRRQGRVDRVASIRVAGRKLIDLTEAEKESMTKDFLNKNSRKISDMLLSIDPEKVYKPSGDLIADALRSGDNVKISQMQKLLGFTGDSADGVFGTGTLTKLEDFLNVRDTTDRQTRFASLGMGNEYSTNPNALASIQNDIKRLRLAWQQFGGKRKTV